MRILIDARKWEDFGIGTYVKVLLGGLASLNPKDLFIETLHRGPSPPSRFPSHPFLAADYSIREIAGMGMAARLRWPDLFHIPHFTRPLLSPPCVLTVHDLIHLRFPGFFGRSVKYAVLKSYLPHALRKARRVIAVSQTTAQEIRTFFPGISGKVTVIPGAALPEFYEPQAFSRNNYFLFVGNDKRHKNLPFLLAAWKRFHAEQPGTRLLLVTPGHYAGEGVEIMRAVPPGEMPALIGSALALIAPSLWEGFDLPVLEAMLLKTPVLASDIPVHREFLGAHPYCFPPDKEEALVGLLRHFIRRGVRPEPMDSLHEKAMAWRPQDMAASTADLYRSALE
jgi:glycosyltransferase involved in cell wall biosynthesis